MLTIRIARKGDKEADRLTDSSTHYSILTEVREYVK